MNAHGPNPTSPLGPGLPPHRSLLRPHGPVLDGFAYEPVLRLPHARDATGDRGLALPLPNRWKADAGTPSVLDYIRLDGSKEALCVAHPAPLCCSGSLSS